MYSEELLLLISDVSDAVLERTGLLAIRVSRPISAAGGRV
jgi:hypothetical protein